MAHAEGWIEAYELLESGSSLPDSLRAKVLGNRSGLGETMLHWYAIEGAPEVVGKMIALGFDVNTTNEFLQTPLFECVLIERWDMVELLLRHGADVSIKNNNDETILEHLGDPEDHEQAKRLKEMIRNFADRGNG